MRARRPGRWRRRTRRASARSRRDLVQPGRLERVGVVVRQVLPLVDERALVQLRARRPAGAQVVGRLVRRVRAGAVRPVERVDSHDVAVEQLVEEREVEPGDVAGGGREVVEVVVAYVVDEGDRPVTGTGEVPADLRVAAVPLRRGAERGGRLRVHVGVELVDQARDLLVGDHRGVRDLPAAVTLRELRVVGDPHLDVVAHAAQRVVLQVDDALVVVQRQPLPDRADRRRVAPQPSSGPGYAADTGSAPPGAAR